MGRTGMSIWLDLTGRRTERKAKIGHCYLSNSKGRGGCGGDWSFLVSLVTLLICEAMPKYKIQKQLPQRRCSDCLSCPNWYSLCAVSYDKERAPCNDLQIVCGPSSYRWPVRIQYYGERAVSDLLFPSGPFDTERRRPVIIKVWDTSGVWDRQNSGALMFMRSYVPAQLFLWPIEVQI